MGKSYMESLDLKVKYHANRLDISMLDNYERYDKKMRFTVNSGEYEGLQGLIDYTGIRRAKKVSYNSLTKESKQRYWNQIAKEKGCAILEHDPQFKIHNELKIRDANGMLVTTTLSNLKRYRTSYRGLPLGEHAIISILQHNKINYTQQVPIYTNIGKQFIDIVAHVSGGSVAIEYNGLQHYSDTNYTSVLLEKQKQYDYAKQLYCEQHNIPLIQIPYTVDTLPEISKCLEKYLDITSVPPHVLLLSDRDKKLLTDYIQGDMTRRQVAKKYHVCEATVSSIAKKYGMRKKAKNSKSVELQSKAWDILYDYIYLGLSRKEVAERYHVCLNSVTSIAKQNGYTKNSAGSVFPYY